MRAALLVVPLLLAGCGGSYERSVETARKAIEAAASAGQAADNVVAAECYEAPEPRADAHAQACSTATDSLITARESLLSAQESVDAWESGASKQGAMHTLACIAGALGRARDAMEAAGIDIPEKLHAAVELASTFGRRNCQHGGR